MKVTYTPEGDAPQVFEFKPKLVRSGMAEMIETRAGARFWPWIEDVFAGGIKARRVLLWHLLSRVHGHIKLEDVDFAVGELEVERDLDELLELRADIESWSGAGKEELRAQALEEADLQIAKLRAEGATEEDPKVSVSFDADTPS